MDQYYRRSCSLSTGSRPVFPQQKKHRQWQKKHRYY